MSWEGWTFRLGFDPREGLVLHQLSIADRPVVYRASVAEMVVPYADPGPVRFWQNYFDAGEYLLGQQVNSLALGLRLRRATSTTSTRCWPTRAASPRTVQNAVCMHEEDAGVLWKHTDLFTESAETRRQRRLVISFFVTVGNYDYGFYWYLYLDGTIELEVKATGVLFTSAYDPTAPWSTEVAPGLGAPFHQHLFCARLDMTVDGVSQRGRRDRPAAGAGGRGQPVRQRVHPHGDPDGPRVESAAGWPTASVGRVWRIANTERTNRLGQPVAYVLRPRSSRRCWPTRARRWPGGRRSPPGTCGSPGTTRRERYPAGELVNQHPGGAGMPAWTAADRRAGRRGRRALAHLRRHARSRGPRTGR